jgi:hypothetical protein
MAGANLLLIEPRMIANPAFFEAPAARGAGSKKITFTLT